MHHYSMPVQVDEAASGPFWVSGNNEKLMGICANCNTTSMSCTPSGSQPGDYLLITNLNSLLPHRSSRIQCEPTWRETWPGATEEEIEAVLHSTGPTDTASIFAAAISGLPRTYQQALASLEKELWTSAMQSEYNELLAQGTWKLVDLPSSRKAIKSKWVYNVKYNKDGNMNRYKARLVAKGFT